MKIDMLQGNSPQFVLSLSFQSSQTCERADIAIHEALSYSLGHCIRVGRGRIVALSCSGLLALLETPMLQAGSRRNGDYYTVKQEEIDKYHKDGYVHLKGVLTEEEMEEIEREYMRFINREVEVIGRDFCDMSGDYSKPLKDYSIINIMLPSRYNPALKGNAYERVAASIAEQICGPDLALDYDQLLAKPPNKPDAVFHWHQDLGYWPITPDTRTASFWLAIDDSRIENGCLKFVPGSHLEAKLRSHGPLHGDRDKSHTMAATLREGDEPVSVEINRGDVTVHHERVLHGSGGNSSGDSWRRAWVLAYRARKTVEEERRVGFTHSHNDKLEVLNEVGKEEGQ